MSREIPEEIAETRRLLVGSGEYSQAEVDAMTDDEVRTASFASFYVDETGYA